MDQAPLTWREKLAIADVTLRVACAILLAIVGCCELLIASGS